VLRSADDWADRAYVLLRSTLGAAVLAYVGFTNLTFGPAPGPLRVQRAVPIWRACWGWLVSLDSPAQAMRVLWTGDAGCLLPWA